MLVAAQRRGDDIDRVIDNRDDVAIAAVTAAELLTGIELVSRQHSEAYRAYVERMLTSVPIEEYDLSVARAHAVLLAHTRRAGRQRGRHDLIIAATAVAKRREVVSHDEAGFLGLPGVILRHPPD